MNPRLYVKRDLPFDLFDVNLIDSNDDELMRISADLRIGLSLDEMKALRKRFFFEERNPTDVEVQTFGQTWSEHCYHKTFKGDIVHQDGTPAATNIMKTYIAKVVEELRPPWCLDVFRDNAGILLFESQGDTVYAIAAKVETHNHPSAIEPFGGAATGTGGVIRDVLGVWAKPIACTDVLCFGPLDYDYGRLPEGMNHPSYLFDGVVAGIGAYGNNMGIPTVNGAICFGEGYVGNVVVFCGCVGILPMNKFVRDTKPTDIAVLMGGRTGRDGIHGVTFASAEVTEESGEVYLSAVQVPNPIEEEKVRRAILEIRDRELASAITDLGGGGLSCAAGEMAHRAHCGIQVDLEKVPLKETDPPMVPWEVWISESQERMFLSVPERNLEEVLGVCEREDVEAAAIGRFTVEKTLRVSYNDSEVAHLDLEFLFNPPRATRSMLWKRPSHREPRLDEPEDLTKELLTLLSSPNVASKGSVIRSYDHEVQGNTVLKPLQGRTGGPNDAAVIKPLTNSWKGVAIACGIRPNYGKIDSYWMAASAIDEAIRNTTAVGGRRIALLDNFVWGNPEKADRVGSLLRACQACYRYAKAFGTPFVSGKDSLYNESPLGPVTPTLLITAIGLVPDIRKVVSMDTKKPGDMIYIVGRTYHELGGSEYYRSKGFIGRRVPRVRVGQAKKVMKSITRAIDAGYLRACHDISEGGIAVAAAEMAIGGDLGMDLFLRRVPAYRVERNDYVAFSESNSRFLVEVPEMYVQDFEGLMRTVVYSPIGRVKKDKGFSVYGLDGELVIDTDISEIGYAWKSAFG
ncbi:MAG: phosphoribosylformylglycinamidine synthase subunit PurL [Candidatus Bathyarchaeia archaeon]